MLTQESLGILPLLFLDSSRTTSREATPTLYFRHILPEQDYCQVLPFFFIFLAIFPA